MVKVYYSGNMKLKSSKGKGTWDEVQEELGASFQVSSPSAVAQVPSIAQQ